jgi:hypothetical protein
MYTGSDIATSTAATVLPGDPHRVEEAGAALPMAVASSTFLGA